MKRKTLITALTALAVVLLPSAASAAPTADAASSAPTVQAEAAQPLAAPVLYRKVRNLAVQQEICLDADNGTLGQNGTKVQLWQCNGWDNQAWYLNPIPGKPTGWYTITNLGHNKCLDADNGTIGGNGTRVQMWDCNGWENQQWLVFGNHTVQNAVSRRCLDGDTVTLPANGTKVQLWDCNGGAHQAWFFFRS
jgi:hypothetical protein